MSLLKWFAVKGIESAVDGIGKLGMPKIVRKFEKYTENKFFNEIVNEGFLNSKIQETVLLDIKNLKSIIDSDKKEQFELETMRDFFKISPFFSQYNIQLGIGCIIFQGYSYKNTISTTYNSKTKYILENRMKFISPEVIANYDLEECIPIGVTGALLSHIEQCVWKLEESEKKNNPNALSNIISSLKSIDLNTVDCDSLFEKILLLNVNSFALPWHIEVQSTVDYLFDYEVSYKDCNTKMNFKLFKGYDSEYTEKVFYNALKNSKNKNIITKISGLYDKHNSTPVNSIEEYLERARLQFIASSLEIGFNNFDEIEIEFIKFKEILSSKYYILLQAFIQDFNISVYFDAINTESILNRINNAYDYLLKHNPGLSNRNILD